MVQVEELEPARMQLLQTHQRIARETELQQVFACAGKDVQMAAPATLRGTRGGIAVIDGPWKLISLNDRKTFALYNLEQDIAEKNDLAAAQPDRVKRLRGVLETWTQQCAASFAGADYR